MRTSGIKARGGFTLIELLIGIIVGTAVFIALFFLFSFASKQVSVYVERYHMYSQVGNALDHMRAHLVHAVDIDPASRLESAADELDFSEGDTFRFEAEADINRITPDNRQDNAQYEYRLENGGLVCTKDGGRAEVLVDPRFRPNVKISLGEVNPQAASPVEREVEPHFLVVTISAVSAKQRLSGVSRTIVKVEGIKLWFIDALE